MNFNYIGKLFAEIDGIKYYDYDFYSVCSGGDSNDIIVDDTLRKNISNIDNITDNVFVSSTAIIPKQSNIYLSTKCPYSIYDVRKNYHIKREIDSGDYNVLCPRNYNLWYIFSDYAVISSEKKLISSNVYTYKSTFCTEVMEYLGKKYDQVEFFTSSGRLNLYGIPDAKIYEKILKNEVIKPCVSYTQLDLSSDLEVTMDLIQLLYTLGNQGVYNRENQKNYVQQLHVLNQHNWRQYKGTLSILFKYCSPMMSYMKRTPSRYDKPINELMSCTDVKFSNDKDFYLAQQFVDNLLNIGDQRFTNCSTLVDKLSHTNIPLDVFAQLYNEMTKITKKKYEGKEESN